MPRAAPRAPPRFGVRAAPVGLWPRGVITTARAPARSQEQDRLGHPFVVDWHGLGHASESAKQVEHPVVSGILGRNALGRADVAYQRVRHRRARRLQVTRSSRATAANASSRRGRRVGPGAPWRRSTRPRRAPVARTNGRRPAASRRANLCAARSRRARVAGVPRSPRRERGAESERPGEPPD
jgi:hypothetical protein